MAGEVRIEAPGWGQRLLRLSRDLIDACAAPFAAVVGLVALAFLLILVVMGLATIASPIVQVTGPPRLAAGLAPMVMSSHQLVVGWLLIPGMFAAVALGAAVVGWARAGRYWALWLVFLGAAPIALLADMVGFHPASLTLTLLWTLVRIVFPLVLAGAALLGVTALVILDRRAVTRIARRWPRLSVPILVARYGLTRPGFWAAFGGRALLVAVKVVGIALGFAIGMVLMLGAAGQILEAMGFPPELTQKYALTVVGDTGMAAAMAVLSARSAWRNPVTRWADLAMLGISCLTLWDMSDAIRFAYMIWRQTGTPFFAEPFTSDELDVFEIYLVAWLIRSLASGTLVKGYRSLQQVTARSARELTEARKEPPILFLRSFDDDEQQVPSSDVLLAYAFGAARPRVRLEELVARLMFAKGPLVALANPRVKARPIGAARDVVEDAQWQETVLGYLAASQIVVCFFGHTPSFMWEIDRILESGRLPRTLIVFPPDYVKTRTIFEHTPRLAELLGLASADDERARFSGLRALVFDAAANAMEAITDPRADSFAYEQAIVRAAAQVQLNAAAA